MLSELKRRAAPMHPALLVLGAGNAVEVLCLSHLGQEHLLAYGLVLPLLLLLDAIGLGAGAGAASLYARTNPMLRVRVARCGLVWAFAVGLVCVTGLLVFGYVCGDGGLADAYILYWAPTIPFALLNFSAFALLRAADRSRLAARGILLGGALQAVLTPMFVFGVGIFPAMGISGAGLAHTVAALSVSAALLLLTRSDQARGPLLLTDLLAIGRALLRLGLPAALSNVTVPLGAAVLMALLRSSHEGFVAAFALALRIEGFCLVAFYAYSAVVGPLAVAQPQMFPQASFWALLKTCRNHCLALGAGLAAVLAFLPFTFNHWLISCPDSVSPLQQYFWTVPLSYGAYGFVMLANGVFNGLGKPYCGLGVSTLRCLILLWPTALVLNQIWPGHGVYMAITLSNILSAVVAALVLQRVRAPVPDPVSLVPHQPLERKLL